MKSLSEFAVDFDEVDGKYYLVHRACESIEAPVNPELPAASPDLVTCIDMAKAHLKELHGVEVDRFDPQDCPTANDHIIVEFCGNCGYSSKG